MAEDFNSLYTFCKEDEIPEEFFCPICCYVLKEAITTACCQIMFCKNCITRVDKCPICSNQNFNIFPPPKYVTNKINSIQVQCKICKEGFIQSNIIQHLKECIEIHFIKCDGRSLGCNFVGSKDDIKEHQEKCFFINGKDFIKMYNEERKMLYSNIDELKEEIKELKSKISILMSENEKSPPKKNSNSSPLQQLLSKNNSFAFVKKR